jgi:type IV secretory pathway protease TraF
MATRHHKTILAMAAVGLVSLTAKPLINPVPLLIWNASDSVPVGWYFVAKRPPKVREIAVIKPLGWVQLYASERGYLPENAWLLKPIYAAHPSIICRFGSHVFVDGKYVAKAKIKDRKHRLLPVWKGCKRLGTSHYFVLGKRTGSFDSRYFGPVHADQAIGIARRLIVLGK